MENESQNLRKQLAVAVRSIQWSYAIFWSLSTKEEGVLEWHEGYYNGDIKTRKTVPTMELKADKTGLQRSEQLKELYKALLEDDTSENQQQANNSNSNSNNNNNNKKSQSSSSLQSPASLSPEDLTDAEWYYLVCMSFAFKPGQGLPGRALSDGKTVWLCNADYADSKVFSRSLLAKSASIQTVVCFPHLSGVIEIGVTDLVPEDLNLLQHIKASLLDFSKPVCIDDLSRRTVNDNDNDEEEEDNRVSVKIDTDMVGSFDLEILCSSPKDNADCRDEFSNGFRQNHHEATEDSFMIEQVQSWHFMDEDLSIGVRNSSDCISKAFAEKTSPNRSRLRELQRFNDTKLSSLDIGADDDLHYKQTVAAVLGGSSKLIEHLWSCACDPDSSFMAWKKSCAVEDFSRPRSHQKILKKILFSVPFMYEGSSLEPPSKDFLGLRSIVPSIHKTDKETVLNDTIKYLKELEARVEELESCTDSVTHKARTQKKSLGVVEQTSENSDRKKKVWMNKRKACDIDESHDPDHHHHNKDGLSLDLKVRVTDQEVLIDMKCPYKEYVLLDIMEAINHLHLDSHSVQSSTLDGVFTLSLKSKFRGTAIAPVGMIKQALWKVAGTKC